MIHFNDFAKIDIHLGTIIQAESFKEAKKPAFKLWIDFGSSIGIKKTSAQITAHYTPEKLIGKQILGVTNFPPKQIGPFMSEVLVLGLSDNEGKIVLITPDWKAPNGSKLS